MAFLSFSTAMTPEVERWRCATPRGAGAATFEMAMARVAIVGVFLSSLDENMLLRSFFSCIVVWSGLTLSVWGMTTSLLLNQR